MSSSAVNGSCISYSVPEQTKLVLENGILKNELISKDLPADSLKYSENIVFKGTSAPSTPINWRFAESIGALKGLEAVMLQELLVKKYGENPHEIVIDTDHAQLFFMSPLLTVVDSNSEAPISLSSFAGKVPPRFYEFFPDYDFFPGGGGGSDSHRGLATNIYRTKDDKFFHLHGSLNPEPTLDALGLPHNAEYAKPEDGVKLFADTVLQIDSSELQNRISNEYKQAGTICWTTEEYANSEHGIANSDIGLWELHSIPDSKQPPSWWPSSPQTSTARPLAGLKVIDLTRIIAAPAITRGLAELGASVMRITASHLPDFSLLHPDLNWGKWNAHLDLRQGDDREKLRSLILDADVVVSGYRPGVMEKWGFGPQDIIKLCENRERGIIVARENCYGWTGPWSGRSGWQQISDACCGVSTGFGRAMGNDEPVTPVFPNSDYCTGVAGICGILAAIIKRGAEGGSYQVDIALNYYSQWLVNSVGEYSAEVWDDLWTRNGRRAYKHTDNMGITLPAMIEGMVKSAGKTLFNPDFFEHRRSEVLNIEIRTIRPVLTFPAGGVKPGFTVGTRGNGRDAARWPEDLTTEVVV